MAERCTISSMSSKIRPARSQDIPSVVGLVRELAAFEKLPGPDEEAERRFAEDFTAGRYELRVAEEEDGQIVAYALFFMTYSTFLARPSLFLEDLFVQPAVRGLGLGAAFLHHLGALAVARGCGRFEWTVLDWNVRAQKFYQRLGAQLLPEWQVCRIDGAALTRLGQAG